MKNRTIVTMLLAVSALLALADAASAYYSPRLGRFLNRDPLNEQGAMLTRTGRQPTTFLARDQLVPAEQNLYAFVGNRPVDHVDVLGLWTKNGVLMYLCRTDQGRQVADNLDRRAKVLKSEFVRSYFHTRASVADPWGPWQNVDWGGMTINRHDIHVPKDFGDDETALILTHEVVHVTSSGESAELEEEIAAYAAETLLALITPGLTPRSEFVRIDADGRQVVDYDAIRTMVVPWYTGWYGPSPLKEYKSDAAGHRIIDYGVEEEVKKWKCDCPKEFYYYDYGYPPRFPPRA